MSDLTTSFTFRLTRTDKAALSTLAARIGTDRGAVLRLFIRRRTQTSHMRRGAFTTKGRVYPIRLQTKDTA